MESAMDGDLVQDQQPEDDDGTALPEASTPSWQPARARVPIRVLHTFSGPRRNLDVEHCLKIAAEKSGVVAIVGSQYLERARSPAGPRLRLATGGLLGWAFRRSHFSPPPLPDLERCPPPTWRAAPLAVSQRVLREK